MILVVDDDAVSRLVAEHILSKAGHEVVSADSAADALEQLNEDVDAIVCDYLMPEQTGLDLLEILGSDASPVEECPPFVLLTGIGEAADLDDERAEGLAGYLTKPVRSDELIACIESFETD